jgi:hypothetical protein
MAITTGRTMRIPDPTWMGALATAESEDEKTNVTAKVVAFLDWYRGLPGAEMPTRPADPAPAPLDLDAGETVVAFVSRAIRNELERERRREAREAKTAT